jgi:hypothetical protein
MGIFKGFRVYGISLEYSINFYQFISMGYSGDFHPIYFHGIFRKFSSELFPWDIPGIFIDLFPWDIPGNSKKSVKPLWSLQSAGSGPRTC